MGKIIRGESLHRIYLISGSLRARLSSGEYEEMKKTING